MTDSGYEQKNPSEEKQSIPSPSTRNWEIEKEAVGGEGIYARVKCDGEPIGMLRLPNSDYLIFLRLLLKLGHLIDVELYKKAQQK